MKKWYYLLAVIVVTIIIAVVYLALERMPTTSPIGTPVATSTTPAIETATTTEPADATQLGGYFSERTSPTLGTYLADKNGLTLYTYGNDAANVSNCTGACLQAWPAYGPGISASGTFNLPMLPVNVATIKGNDGMVQFTWKEMPLYYYSGDKAAGDTSGEGIGGVWYVVNL